MAPKSGGMHWTNKRPHKLLPTPPISRQAARKFQQGPELAQKEIQKDEKQEAPGEEISTNSGSVTEKKKAGEGAKTIHIQSAG